MNDQIDTPSHGTAPSAAGRRWFWLILVLAVAAFLYSSSKSKSSGGSQELQTALDRASEKNHLVLVDFFTANCGYCRMMDENVLPRDDVQAVLQNWIKVDIDGALHSDLAREYKVEGYPTYLALAPDGRILSVLPGAVSPESFIEWLESAEQKWSTTTQPG
jgi:thiol:disulfide interchange protein